MHRWTISTYVSFCSMPEEMPVMQQVIPREALRHECLMNGILSLAALDAAVTSNEIKSAQYVRAALEYYDKAISSFRSQLSNLTAENSAILFILSTLMAAINLAMLRCPNAMGDQQSVLGRIPTIFNMLMGSNSIVLLCWRWILESPVQLRVQLPYGKASVDIIGLDDRNALNRLSSINYQYYFPAGVQIDAFAEDTHPEYELYVDAIASLEYCFAEDTRASIKSFCVVFPILAGHGFTTAIVQSHPIALLILMHWAVLLERLGRDAWWATTAGASLVAEISKALHSSALTLMPEAQEAMLWAQQQVGLLGMPDPLVSTPENSIPSSVSYERDRRRSDS
jgi:hypothetical protein